MERLWLLLLLLLMERVLPLLLWMERFANAAERGIASAESRGLRRWASVSTLGVKGEEVREQEE